MAEGCVYLTVRTPLASWMAVWLAVIWTFTARILRGLLILGGVPRNTKSPKPSGNMGYISTTADTISPALVLSPSKNDRSLGVPVASKPA